MDVQKIYDVELFASRLESKGYERSIEMCNDYHILGSVIVNVFAAMQQGT